MASLILSSLGAAVGGPIGGAVGALVGAAADARIAAALRPGRVAPSRLADLQVQTSSEGAGVALVYGAMRVAGEVIWASQFRETASTSRVGGKTGQKVTERRYSISLAIGLCEGVASGLGQVWANGEAFDLSRVAYRFHDGAPDQDPDPLIEAIEGAAPAYRGLAYVVFEDLPLAAFGDRIPQFAFEVIRPAPSLDGLEALARGVCLIPGSGEFALATVPVTRTLGPGRSAPENCNAVPDRADLEVALDQLQARLPNVCSVLLVVSWFGSDLRAGLCRVEPGVDSRLKTTEPLVWSVAGRTRATARLVSQIGGTAAYGGTPSDESVIQAIQALKARGFSVGLYPFVMMDVPAGSGLPDPYGGAEQAAFPWRGRITCAPAPGLPGSPDMTPAAADQVEAFFGTAEAGHFHVGDVVTYSGPEEWTFRRCVLHCAALAQAAGGVDRFVIGSELVGLTRVRSARRTFPAVAALKALAGQARALLGPATALTYAADWTEYGAYRPADGSGDVLFPLDALWADPAIDAVGIDWYAPLADWRAGGGLDQALTASPYARAYLDSQVEGGEGFDWFYASPADRAAQTRTPIGDGLGKPWINRVKDLNGWWANPHVERLGGVEQAEPTAWVAQSKPIWLTELGVPAVDKGANQPNVFIDPKSAESALPHFSAGTRDDRIQRRALEAVLAHWAPAAGRNPTSAVYGGPMLPPDRIHLWCWDARPFPHFPALADVWSDGGNWTLGHWLTGRVGPSNLADVVADLCRRAGLDAIDAGALDGAVAGFLVEQPQTARAALEQLMAAYAFDARERDGVLSFFHLDDAAFAPLDPARLAVHGGVRLARIRAAEAAIGACRVQAIDPARGYRAISVSAPGPGADAARAETLSLSLALSPGACAALAAQGLADARAAMDRAEAAFPPSLMAIEAGDRLALPDGAAMRVERLAERAQMVAVARGGPPGGPPGAMAAPVAPPPAPARPRPVLTLLDLPALDGTDGIRPWAAVSADPWPGAITLYAGPEASALTPRATIDRPALQGALAAPLPPGPADRWDRAGAAVVTLVAGTVPSHSAAAVLNGAGLVAVAAAGGVELIQYREAVLIAERTWRLSILLRGRFATEAAAAAGAPAGASVVVLDGAVARPALTDWERGLPLVWRAVAADRPVDDAAGAQASWTCAGRPLQPWAPIRPRAVRGAAGVDVTWIRRARRGGEGFEGEPPLIDSPERYRLRLFLAGAPLAAVTTDAPVWRLTPGEEAALFGGAQGALDLEIAQIGDVWGPGAALRRLVTIL